MSSRASHWAWNQASVEGTALLVLLAIADDASDVGPVSVNRISLPDIARKARISDKTVRRTIPRLVELGAIVPHGRPGVATEYQIINPAKMTGPTPDRMTGQGGVRLTGVRTDESAERAAPGALDHVSDTPVNVAGVDPGQSDTPDKLSGQIDRGSCAHSLTDLLRPPRRAPPGGGARCSRIPEDFELTAPRRAIAVSQGLHPARTFAKFRAHWRAASGSRARKADWDAAWEYWCLSDDDAKPRTASGGQGGPSLIALNNSARLLGIDPLRDGETAEQLEARISTAQTDMLEQKARKETGAGA